MRRSSPEADENPPQDPVRGLTLRSGQLFTVDAQNRTQTDLNKLGIFRSVNLSVTPLDSLRGSDTLDVAIDAQFDYPLEAALETAVTYEDRTASSAPASTFKVTQQQPSSRGGRSPRPETERLRTNGRRATKTPAAVPHGSTPMNWD